MFVSILDMNQTSNVSELANLYVRAGELHYSVEVLKAQLAQVTMQIDQTRAAQAKEAEVKAKLEAEAKPAEAPAPEQDKTA